jgi:hypothetical protein
LIHLIFFQLGGCIILAGFIAYLFRENIRFDIGLPSFYIALVFVLILVHWLYPRYLIFRGKYYARPMTEEEYQNYNNRYLIHYTDKLRPSDVEHYERSGSIKLSGSDSIRSNYSLPPAERDRKYVWFHLSQDSSEPEPSFCSFWKSHGHELIPRAHKVVVLLEELKREQLLIRDVDKAVLLIGDYSGEPHSLSTAFNWYNDKVYWWYALKSPWKGIFVLFHMHFSQKLGAYKDKKKALDLAK